MRIIGLTGGIASGKSTVSNIALNRGIPVIDADKIAREIVQKGKPAFGEIVEFFGPQIIDDDGNLDRKALGDIVFTDKLKLRKLNDITHPKIIGEIKIRLESLKNKKEVLAIIDAALLIEMNMRELVDVIWLVVASEPLQIQRLMQRDGLIEEEALERIKSQMSTDEKAQYADAIINNCGDLQMLKNNVDELIDKLY